mmetsp:Transcript_91161/g.174877  ORF Transcript_91161/g.174877 Transcript_91161/m.174877 type:complete len:237 (-) Transcript_91161:266-976(-)
MCGVNTTLGRSINFAKGWSSESGSLLKTSRPAPAMRLSRIASTSAFSSTSAPLAEFTRYAVFFMRPMSEASKIPRVSSERGMKSPTTSEHSTSSCMPIFTTPNRFITSASTAGSQATTRMRKPRHSIAKCEPMWPRPMMPQVFPQRSTPLTPGRSGSHQRRSFMDLVNIGRLRVNAISIASVCSATAGAPYSGMLTRGTPVSLIPLMSSASMPHPVFTTAFISGLAASTQRFVTCM